MTHSTIQHRDKQPKLNIITFEPIINLNIFSTVLYGNHYQKVPEMANMALPFNIRHVTSTKFRLTFSLNMLLAILDVANAMIHKHGCHDSCVQHKDLQQKLCIKLWINLEPEYVFSYYTI